MLDTAPRRLPTRISPPPPFLPLLPVRAPPPALTFSLSPPPPALRQITIPTLVAIGDQDERSDADQLAALLQDARFVRVPGDHGSAFAAPELAVATAAFLAEKLLVWRASAARAG